MNFKRLIVVLLGIVLVLIIILMVKTVTYPFHNAQTSSVNEVSPKKVVAPEKSIERFAGGIRIPTVSNAIYEETDFEPFDEFKAYLPQAYPAIYKVMDTITINKYGLVFHWKGKNSSLNPILFLSHYDVVPVNGYEPEQYREYETIYRPGDQPVAAIDDFQSKWDYPPFSGAVIDGRVYGRGTLDMKGMLFGILEAADALIAEGFQPERDIWFAFGHDEEVSGRQGAVHIADYFKEQGLTFDAVYDEGSFVLADGLEGIDRPLALVGVGEKGFLTVKIRVYGIGGILLCLRQKAHW